MREEDSAVASSSMPTWSSYDTSDQAATSSDHDTEDGLATRTYEVEGELLPGTESLYFGSSDDDAHSEETNAVGQAGRDSEYITEEEANVDASQRSFALLGPTLLPTSLSHNNSSISCLELAEPVAEELEPWDPLNAGRLRRYELKSETAGYEDDYEDSGYTADTEQDPAPSAGEPQQEAESVWGAQYNEPQRRRVDPLWLNDACLVKDDSDAAFLHSKARIYTYDLEEHEAAGRGHEGFVSLQANRLVGNGGNSSLFMDDATAGANSKNMGSGVSEIKAVLRPAIWDRSGRLTEKGPWRPL